MGRQQRGQEGGDQADRQQRFEPVLPEPGSGAFHGQIGEPLQARHQYRCSPGGWCRDTPIPPEGVLLCAGFLTPLLLFFSSPEFGMNHALGAQVAGYMLSMTNRPVSC